MQLAADRLEPMDVSVARHAGAVLRRLRYGVEYVHDPGTMPGVQSPMGVHIVSALRPMVAAQRLVRAHASAAVVDDSRALAESHGTATVL